MKVKENLHRDYFPVKVIESIKSQTIQGTVIKLRFKKVGNFTTFEVLKKILHIKTFKDIYYWLPYKSIVEASSKYSVIGSQSRSPYSACWMEIKEKCIIYEEGIKKFIRAVSSTKRNSRSNLTSLPFYHDELTVVTRKKVISMLDQHLFNKNKTISKDI